MKKVRFMVTFETEKDGFTDDELHMAMREISSSVTVITDLKTYEHFSLQIKEVELKDIL